MHPRDSEIVGGGDQRPSGSTGSYQLVGYTEEQVRRFDALEARLQKSHDQFADMIPEVLTALRDLLTDKSAGVRERGIKLWSQMQEKRFFHQIEAKRLHGEQADRVMTHFERMKGATEKQEESFFARANREG